MRDDSAKWLPAKGLDRPEYQTDSVRLSIFKPIRQTLLSGPVEKCLALVDVDDAYGWPDPVPDGPYALRLRRDRILMVNGPELEDGWQGGVAVSDVTDGYAVIAVDGPDAFALLQRGTEISAMVTSASVSRMFAGFGVFLSAAGEKQFRLHVARGHLEALGSGLEGFARQAEAERRGE